MLKVIAHLRSTAPYSQSHQIERECPEFPNASPLSTSPRNSAQRLRLGTTLCFSALHFAMPLHSTQYLYPRLLRHRSSHLVAVRHLPLQRRTLLRDTHQLNAMSKRKRFRILRRDNYTCQYCGRKPPEVVLHIERPNTILTPMLIDSPIGYRQKIDDDKTLASFKTPPVVSDISHVPFALDIEPLARQFSRTAQWNDTKIFPVDADKVVALFPKRPKP